MMERKVTEEKRLLGFLRVFDFCSEQVICIVGIYQHLLTHTKGVRKAVDANDTNYLLRLEVKQAIEANK
jgi:hypothetical protein